MSLVKTEILDLTTLKWSEAPQYPFVYYKGWVFCMKVTLSLAWIKKNFSSISQYSTVHTTDAVFIIGGFETQDIIAEFKDDQWRRMSDLRKERWLHGSITLEGQTMIVGGKQLNYQE